MITKWGVNYPMFIFLFCVQMSLLMIIQSNHELKKEMEGQFELYYCSLFIGKCSILFGQSRNIAYCECEFGHYIHCRNSIGNMVVWVFANLVSISFI